MFRSTALRFASLIVLAVVSPAFAQPAVATFSDAFESSSLGTFPSGWEYRFFGGGVATAHAPCEIGAQALRIVGLPFSACEIHTLQRFTASRGQGVLSFSLMWSSESTNPGLACNDITVNYQGQYGQMVAGFVHSDNDPAGLRIYGTARPVQRDRWYRFVGVADFTRRTVDWYVDGELVVARQTMSPGTNPDRINRIECHAGCIDAGQTVGYIDAINFIPPPPCPADLTGDSQLTVQDLFDYLAIYFAGCP